MNTKTLPEFFACIRASNKAPWVKTVEFVLHTFGTALACNRFAIGEIIESATRDMLVSCGIQAVSVPSAKRYDLKILNVTDVPHVSCKFVSDDKSVILHNSQRKLNSDVDMIPTLLFTVKEWWYLSPETLSAHDVNVQNYMKNNGDSLQLDLKMLGILREKEYPYYLQQPLTYDKSSCLRKPTSDLTYTLVKDLFSPETPTATRDYIQTVLDSLESVPAEDDETRAARQEKERLKEAATAAAKDERCKLKAEQKAKRDAEKAVKKAEEKERKAAEKATKKEEKEKKAAAKNAT